MFNINNILLSIRQMFEFSIVFKNKNYLLTRYAMWKYLLKVETVKNNQSRGSYASEWNQVL